MAALLFFAFVSGVITILSPCILPVLPVVLSGGAGGGKARPLGVIAGFVASFTFFTLALAVLVGTLGVSADALRIVAVVVLVLFGLVMAIPRLDVLFQKLLTGAATLAQKITRRRPPADGTAPVPRKRTGFPGGLAVGLSLGLVWTPCVGPIMASVAALANAQRVDGGAVLITLAYSLGTALPMFAVMFGGRQLLTRVPWLAKRSGAIQRVFGALMILTGVAVAFGLDRRFQSAILQIFPDYGSGLTAVENNPAVFNTLAARRSTGSMTSGRSPSTGTIDGDRFSGVPANTRPDPSLPDYGLAPEFTPGANWLNSSALTLAGLKGKVVLVDFWTYSCVNCVRTLPWLRAWHEAYRDRGFVIVGIHTPEFEFEKSASNLAAAARDLGVTWPVVQDNDYAAWHAYQNHYWPAHYFIDARGRVRYFHFGEGAYAESEAVIRKLLAEIGAPVAERVSGVARPNAAATPETYLGHGRMTGYAGLPAVLPDAAAAYSLPGTLANGRWGLSGKWTVREEYIESDGTGALELSFTARDVFLVIAPVDPGARVSVRIDGAVGRDTLDVRGGELTAGESRLYRLAGLERPGNHRLRLETRGRIRFYAFTFG